MRMAKPRRAGGFYDSPAWKQVRRLALIRDRFCCVICGCSVRGKGKSRVDHIHSIHARPDLALVLSNLRTLCTLHDAQAHREKGGAPDASRQGKRNTRFVIKGADASGMPTDPGHPWLNGR